MMKQLIVSALLIAMAAASASAAQSLVKRAKVFEGNGGSTLTLDIEGPSGKPLQLIHVQGVGWRYADSLATNAVRSTTRETEQLATPTEEFLAVFVDGPSGFAYAWNSDQGWKFIGRVSGGAS